MKVVFDFVQGKLSYDEFETEFILHPEIWTWIQELVPKDIGNLDCEFRSIYHNMQAFETNNYNVKSTIMTFGYDDIYGQTTAFSLISALIKYHYPKTVCQRPLEQSCNDILETIGLDYIGGEEVDEIIKNIILSHRNDRKKNMKNALKTAFHIAPRKFPHWIQEPEWPAYNGEPMRFIAENHIGEKFTYEFQDINTKETRIITQYS